VLAKSCSPHLNMKPPRLPGFVRTVFVQQRDSIPTIATKYFVVFDVEDVQQ
jgi:hypothetical protein